MNTAFTKFFNFFGLYTGEQIDAAFTSGRRDERQNHASIVENLRSEHHRREDHLRNSLNDRISEISTQNEQLRSDMALLQDANDTAEQKIIELTDYRDRLLANNDAMKADLDFANSRLEDAVTDPTKTPEYMKLESELADTIHSEQHALMDLETTRFELKQARKENDRHKKLLLEQSELLQECKETIDDLTVSLKQARPHKKKAMPKPEAQQKPSDNA